MSSVDDKTLAKIIESYERDGAAVMRNVIPAHWIERLGKASDRIMAEATGDMTGTDLNREGEGRFFAGMFSWLKNAEYAAFIHDAGLGELAGRLMRASEVRFFYDQLLVKEPGTAKRTPWHQDLPYWPVLGEQIISIWIPMDKATPENGVVTYVRGSHRWNAFFPTDNWSDNLQHLPPSGVEEPSPAVYRNASNGTTLADINKHPEKYELITWDVEPGDVIIHHPLTIHGAPGNLSSGRRRRALATRWFGDDARWDDTRPNFMSRLQWGWPDFPYPTLKPGDPIDAPAVFPLVWQARREAAE